MQSKFPLLLLFLLPLQLTGEFISLSIALTRHLCKMQKVSKDVVKIFEYFKTGIDRLTIGIVWTFCSNL